MWAKPVVCGKASGRVRALFNEFLASLWLRPDPPCLPAILGLSDLPAPGDTYLVVVVDK